MTPEDIDALAAAYGGATTYGDILPDGRGIPAPDLVEPVADGRSMVELDKLRLLDELKQRRSRLDTQSKEIGKQIKKLEDELIEQMIESGQVTGLPFDDRKATIRTDVYGKRLDEISDADYFAAFAAAGGEWADLVKETVNSQTLRSKLLEFQDRHAEEYGDASPGLPYILPEPLQAVLTTTAKYSITFSNVAPSRVTQRVRRR